MPGAFPDGDRGAPPQTRDSTVRPTTAPMAAFGLVLIPLTLLAAYTSIAALIKAIQAPPAQGARLLDVPAIQCRRGSGLR